MDSLKENTLKIPSISCPICYKYFNNDTKIITLNCGHYFCVSCLGNSNFTTFFKCSICRSINTEYSLTNINVINLLNYATNRNEPIFTSNSDKQNVKEIEYCPQCNEILISSCFHRIRYPVHETICSDQIVEKIEKNCNRLCEIEQILLNSNASLSDNFELISQLNSNGKFDSFLDEIFFNRIKGIQEKLFSNLETANPNKENIKSEKDLEIVLRENLSKINSLKRVFKRIKNKKTKNEIQSLILQSKYFKQNNSNKKFITSYIKNSKKVVVFDSDFLDMSIYEITELPFNFYKTSHSVEYCPEENKLYISGGKQEMFFPNMCGKVYEYSITKNSLKLIQNLNKEITGHRSIFLNNSLLIIGGRKGLERSEEIFYSEIMQIEKSSHILRKKFFQLKFARSNFGISYENNRIFLTFGISDKMNFLNNIEIISLNTDTPSSYVVYLSDSIWLKDPGCIIDHENHSLIILGGETEINQWNKKIFTFDICYFKLINANEYKEIVSGNFTSYGIKYKSILSVLSNMTTTDDLPHVYLFSEMNKKWTCHSIDIYS